MSASVADDMIRSYFERWQRLEEEKRTISDDLKELFAEARGNGLDTKALRAVFREQVGDKAAAQEFDAICDLYRASLNAPRAGRARESQSYAEAKGRGVVAEFATTETGELTDTQEQPETAPSLNNGEDHDADSGQHFGQQDGQQRGSAPVSGTDGRGESADDGDQGQGAGASGVNRSDGPVAGTIDRQDEDGRSRHVGGEVDHEVTPSDGGAFVAVKGKARLADANSVEPSPSDAVSPSAAPPADTVAEPQAPQAATVPHSNPQEPNSSPAADSPASVSSSEPGSLSEKKDCLKLKDGHCKISFDTSALCSVCNAERMKARAA